MYKCYKKYIKRGQKMKLKIIGAVLCIFILSFSAIPALEVSYVKNYNRDTDENFEKNPVAEDGNKTFGNYSIYTRGPVLKTYTEVELLNGSFFQMKLIDRNLNRRLFRFSILLPSIIIPVKNLDFTVTYKKDIGNNSRYSINTTIWENVYDENGTLVNITTIETFDNVMHTISIQNYSGVFIFQRVKLFAPREQMDKKILRSARFMFNGWCDNFTIIEE